MGRYRSLQVIMHLYGIQWFLMEVYMRNYGSFKDPLEALRAHKNYKDTLGPIRILIEA